jgi:hypothetical protein
MSASIGLNYWAILFSAIVAMVLGFVWFGPIFGKSWMKITGMENMDKATMKQKNKEMGPQYLLIFIGALVIAFVMSSFIHRAIFYRGVAGAVTIAFWLWLGFVVTIKISDAIFSGKTSQQKRDMFWIQVGYYFLEFILMGLILGAWR